MAATAALLATWLIAASLGAMLFFSAAVAPTLFGVLPPEQAGRVLRALFPRYFIINGIVALVAAGLAVVAGAGGLVVALLVACGLALLLTRVIMVPIINAARDRVAGGDATAKATFDRWHRASVLVNLVEMAGLIAAIGMLTTAGP